MLAFDRKALSGASCGGAILLRAAHAREPVWSLMTKCSSLLARLLLAQSARLGETNHTTVPEEPLAGALFSMAGWAEATAVWKTGGGLAPTALGRVSSVGPAAGGRTVQLTRRVRSPAAAHGTAAAIRGWRAPQGCQTAQHQHCSRYRRMGTAVHRGDLHLRLRRRRRPRPGLPRPRALSARRSAGTGRA